MTRFVIPALMAVAAAVGPVAAQEPPPPVIVSSESGGSRPPLAEACDDCAGFDFSKVPPAPRPVARPGMFSILPSGPGYYSAYDCLTGTCREAAPKSAFPPMLLSTLSFFDADWRFLDDPKTPPQDALDRLKRIRVGDNWLVSTGGQTWFRYASEYNSRLTQTDNVYTLYRARPYVDVWYQDKLRFFVEGMFADSVWQDLPPVATDVDRADFQNLFVEAKVGQWADAPVYARVGRQEVQFGSQRLIGAPDWANTRRTFDGARLMRTSEKWDFDLFWLRPLTPNPTELNSSDNNQNFAGAWATYKPRKGRLIDAYYLMLDNTNSVIQQGITRAPFTLHTFGGRLVGDVEGEWLYDVEAAMQLGRRGPQDVVAGMFTAGGGYHWKNVVWNPVVWLYYDYASGDNDPNAGTFTTFNQLFPFGHYYLGWLDLVGRQNIHDLNLQMYLYPAKWVQLWTQYHIFALDQPRDALYGIAGQAYRRDPTGQAGQFVGQELDFIVNLHLSRRLDLLTGYSYLWGGNFLRDTSGPTAGKDSSLYYLSMSYRW